MLRRHALPPVKAYALLHSKVGLGIIGLLGILSANLPPRTPLLRRKAERSQKCDLLRAATSIVHAENSHNIILRAENVPLGLGLDGPINDDGVLDLVKEVGLAK